jgi:hypothetical protein
MTKLIKKNDSRYFSQTSNESYDRHRYKVVFKNGADPVIVDDWEQANLIWFQTPSLFKSHIEVLDK